MASIINPRMTAQIDGDFVLFLIGMRINRWWKPHIWLPVAQAMPRMMRELYSNPELGLLGHQNWFGRTTIMLQYWRSMDHLMDYARARDSEHLPAWRDFNRRVGTSGDIGIWHETYAIQPGCHEAFYAGMPPFGLGQVGTLVPATGRRKDARARLAASRTAEHDKAA